MATTIDYLKEQLAGTEESDASLSAVRKRAFDDFCQYGIPTTRHEEWKYTRIQSLFNKDFHLQAARDAHLRFEHLPGHEGAHVLVFVNGRFQAAQSVIRSSALVVVSLEDAIKDTLYKDWITKHLGHSAQYLKDGINALNTAYVRDGVLVHVKKEKEPAPLYIYNISDATVENVLAQPRSLVYVEKQAQLKVVETYRTLGAQESFTNQVMEMVVEEAAHVEYYKIQNDGTQAHYVSTTHIRQIGKSYVHTVTIALNGGIIRNNANIIMEAPYSEAHLYGLSFQKGETHVDNHTIVDNIAPNCFSNEFYKGMLDDKSTGVFNGKIYVRQAAQKTNAFQSNRNILLSEYASVNAKPQLEIFADDVKCSHGCTVGRLDDEGLFYLQSRGIPEKIAQAMLLQGFAVDILDKINLPLIRVYADQLIAQRLGFELI